MKAWLLGAVFGLAFGAVFAAGVARADSGRLAWSGHILGREAEVRTFTDGNYRCFLATEFAGGSISISCVEHKP